MRKILLALLVGGLVWFFFPGIVQLVDTFGIVPIGIAATTALIATSLLVFWRKRVAQRRASTIAAIAATAAIVSASSPRTRRRTDARFDPPTIHNWLYYGICATYLAFLVWIGIDTWTNWAHKLPLIPGGWRFIPRWVNLIWMFDLYLSATSLRVGSDKYGGISLYDLFLRDKMTPGPVFFPYLLGLRTLLISKVDEVPAPPIEIFVPGHPDEVYPKSDKEFSDLTDRELWDKAAHIIFPGKPKPAEGGWKNELDGPATGSMIIFVMYAFKDVYTAQRFFGKGASPEFMYEKLKKATLAVTLSTLAVVFKDKGPNDHLTDPETTIAAISDALESLAERCGAEATEPSVLPLDLGRDIAIAQQAARMAGIERETKTSAGQGQAAYDTAVGLARNTVTADLVTKKGAALATLGDNKELVAGMQVGEKLAESGSTVVVNGLAGLFGMLVDKIRKPRKTTT